MLTTLVTPPTILVTELIISSSAKAEIFNIQVKSAVILIVKGYYTFSVEYFLLIILVWRDVVPNVLTFVNPGIL